MYDSLAAKAARFQMVHEPDCGECENCLEVARLDKQYAIRRVEYSWGKSGKAEVDNARHAWLEASRLKRCTGRKA
jgi:hypothetical protein